MVANDGAMVGLYPARVGEVEWSKTRPIRPTMRPHDDEMIVW